jgi:hypothetical protein
MSGSGQGVNRKHGGSDSLPVSGELGSRAASVARRAVADHANIEATAQSLDSTARVLERVVAVAGERLADFQRGQDRAVSEASQ